MWLLAGTVPAFKKLLAGTVPAFKRLLAGTHNFFFGFLTLFTKKQDQGSKAPSRDHPDSSFMTRLDSIRVED